MTAAVPLERLRIYSSFDILSVYLTVRSSTRFEDPLMDSISTYGIFSRVPLMGTNETASLESLSEN